jgi:hypothetical protein
MAEKNDREARMLAVTQAAYYAVTGLWPLLDISSFERVTGPKVDRWLVRTVGGLVTTIGASIAIAAREDPRRPETVCLAAGSAALLGAIDTIYAAKRRISPVYLVDALAQTLIVARWVRARG